jgi:hypothetical protein
MSKNIQTVGSLTARPIVENWSKEYKRFGLEYLRPNAVDVFKALFSRGYNTVLLQSIIADMNEYGFGYIDNVHFSGDELHRVLHDVYPVTVVEDNLQNCLWHADNVRLKRGSTLESHFDPQAITMLYGQRVETEKYTGFAAVDAISAACNTVCEDEARTQPTVESVRELADILGSNVDKNRREIYYLLHGVDNHVQRQERAENCTHHTWLQHQTGRLIVFSNSILHANDVVHKKIVELTRNNIIYRRMLPSTPLHKSVH